MTGKLPAMSPPRPKSKAYFPGNEEHTGKWEEEQASGGGIAKLTLPRVHDYMDARKSKLGSWGASSLTPDGYDGSLAQDPDAHVLKELPAEGAGGLFQGRQVADQQDGPAA